jgi:predicted nucleotidyltransferase
MLNAKREFYLREVAQEARVPVQAVQRELARLVRTGILSRSDRGRRSYYRVDTTCPIYPELRGLVLKTSGLGEELRQALSDHSWGIELAFIHGSFAAGTDRVDSDVDLIIVGEIDLPSFNRWLAERERLLKRRINYTHFTRKELTRRLEDGDEFVANVLSGPRVMLVGDENAVAELGR